ncbi:MAG TPA: type II toxin-antitoxin system RelE/ParE family toxin [Candidatus Binatia bacterium]|jgi:mRNA-degrading endonuclease RelE of RelBE toxin-antitoxin system|nr:type II toxin-antitoxin system RelE/ParE family toxin [Candidatus Binatia bacterium]
MYRIEYAEGVADDLANLRAYDRKHILDRLEKQLKDEPTKKTRNRKPLPGLIPPWEYLEPVWELRIGAYRIFYDVDEGNRLVMIRAIRYKPSHKTTEEIL